MNSIRGRVSLFEQRPRSRLLLQIRRRARYLQKGLTSQLSTQEAARMHGEFPEHMFSLMAQLLRLCELSNVRQDVTAAQLVAWRRFRRDDTSLPADMDAFERAFDDVVRFGRVHSSDLTRHQRQRLHRALAKVLRSGALIATSVGLSASHFEDWATRDLAEAA